ncbi:MAG TPA: helix-turn-helix domain-containing protein [Mycobacteriales bacterium]|jgi:predicted ArsR family transcriptional regulator|nr:helix-turn-helix domain-containing protein [Mycobacteriales bacterium]
MSDPGMRKLTDPREIRALAHPVRIALLEALTREGPLTATEAAELVGESPANCSFHFRTLAKYGYVEEAPGAGGRSRPWRRVSVGQTFESTSESPEANIAAQALLQLAQDRALERMRTYIGAWSSYPEEWQKASSFTDSLLYLTPEELTELSNALLEQVDRYRGRASDKSLRPAGSRAVQLAMYAFPLPPTPSGN